MNEKSRLQRFGIGLAITVLVTVVAGAVFGSLAVPLVLAAGFGATILMGGGRTKK